MANINKFDNTQFADNFRLAKSKLLAAPADGTYNLIMLPHYAFVMALWLQIKTAFVAADPATVLEVGWAGNKETAVLNGFMTTDIAEPGVLGLKRAQEETLVTFGGKYFEDGAGMITLTVAAGGATTVGTFRVFCEYTVIM